VLESPPLSDSMIEQSVNDITSKFRFIVLVQSLAGLSVVLYYFVTGSELGVISALYGTLVSLLNAVFFYQRVRKVQTASDDKVQAAVGWLYLSAALRFGLILVLFVVGMGALGLLPLPVCMGFVVAQIGYLFAGAYKASEDN
jgi:ATP synthase protein I